MALFRKKPIEVEAIRYEIDKLPHSAPHWLVRAMLLPCDQMGRVWVQPNGELIIATLEGDMRAEPGDWIICGVKGELYPCKHDIFTTTYEAVVKAKEAA